MLNNLSIIYLPIASQHSLALYFHRTTAPTPKIFSISLFISILPKLELCNLRKYRNSGLWFSKFQSLMKHNSGTNVYMYTPWGDSPFQFPFSSPPPPFPPENCLWNHLWNGKKKRWKGSGNFPGEQGPIVSTLHDLHTLTVETSWLTENKWNSILKKDSLSPSASHSILPDVPLMSRPAGGPMSLFSACLLYLYIAMVLCQTTSIYWKTLTK